MDLTKVQAVREQLIPQNLKDVQLFAGFYNYYRRFIKDYSKIATPLYRFTKKGEPFRWDKPAEEAFQHLKILISEEPILKNFDPDKEAIVETDASDYAIEVRLYQIHDERKHLIVFLSKKLQDAQTRYPIHDKELYVILEACSIWRPYL